MTESKECFEFQSLSNYGTTTTVVSNFRLLRGGVTIHGGHRLGVPGRGLGCTGGGGLSMGIDGILVFLVLLPVCLSKSDISTIIICKIRGSRKSQKLIETCWPSFIFTWHCRDYYMWQANIETTNIRQYHSGNVSRRNKWLQWLEFMNTISNSELE